MRCEEGYCIVCDKEIAPVSCGCGKRSKGPDYTEVMIPWTNGQRMAMAVCLECAPKRVWEVDKRELTEAVWRTWEKMGQKFDREVVIGEQFN